MSSKALITKFASKDGVDARVVERDYVLAHIVALISSNDAEKRLIFKGGSSLRLLHFDDYRYSADLDYSVIKGSEAEAMEVVRSALAKGQRPAAIKQLSLTGASDRIVYVGPLGAERTIKLDLADDELVINTETTFATQALARHPRGRNYCLHNTRDHSREAAMRPYSAFNAATSRTLASYSTTPT